MRKNPVKPPNSLMAIGLCIGFAFFGNAVKGEDQKQVEILVLEIKDGKRKNVLPQCPVFVFNAHGAEVRPGVVWRTDDHGLIKIPMRDNTRYRVVPNTLQLNRNGLKTLLPEVFTISPTTHKSTGFGRNVTVTARTSVDFQSNDVVQKKIDEVMELVKSALDLSKGKRSENLNAFYGELRKLKKELDDDKPILDEEGDDSPPGKPVPVNGRIHASKKKGGEIELSVENLPVFAFDRFGQRIIVPPADEEATPKNRHLNQVQLLLPKEMLATIVVDTLASAQSAHYLPPLVTICPTSGNPPNPTQYDTNVSLPAFIAHELDRESRKKHIASVLHLIEPAKEEAVRNGDLKDPIIEFFGKLQELQGAGVPVQDLVQGSTVLECLVPLYMTDPDRQWDVVFNTARQHRQATFWVIVNPSNGPIPGWEDRYSKYVKAQKSPGSNVRLLGYISLSDPDETVANAINLWTAKSGVAGLFLDNSGPAGVEKSRGLYELAKLQKGLTVFACPGSPLNDERDYDLPTADFFCLGHNSQPSYESIQNVARRKRVGFGVIHHDLNGAMAYKEALAAAINSNCRFVCLSNFGRETRPTHLTSLPTWWNQYVDDLELHNRVAQRRQAELIKLDLDFAPD